jgi:glycosyltransferase involved in cell wall biosynthesis
LKWWQGWVMRHCDRVMVLSEYSRQQIGTLFPSLNPDHVVLIPGGVDVERFRPASDRLAVRARLGLPQNGTILLTVRRLVPRMGLENLLRAFAQVSVVQDDLTLVIGGHGRLESALRVLAAQLGVSDRVQFAGFIPEADLPAYYQAADLFVLPTQALEGFGLITLEALASGLPVVGTPVGSTKEILTRFDARFLTRGTTVSDLVEKIVEVQHILRQETVASRARSFAVTHYDWDSIVDCYEDLYQQLCVTEQA